MNRFHLSAALMGLVASALALLLELLGLPILFALIIVPVAIWLHQKAEELDREEAEGETYVAVAGWCKKK